MKKCKECLNFHNGCMFSNVLDADSEYAACAQYNELIWNVYYYDINRKKIDIFNIFGHSGFKKYIDKIFKEFKGDENKDEFKKRINSELFYYYGSKSEWELIIDKKEDKLLLSPWIGDKNSKDINVSEDKNFDWEGFYEKCKTRYRNYDGQIKFDVKDQVLYNFDEFIERC